MVEQSGEWETDVETKNLRLFPQQSPTVVSPFAPGPCPFNFPPISSNLTKYLPTRPRIPIAGVTLRSDLNLFGTVGGTVSWLPCWDRPEADRTRIGLWGVL